MDPLWGVLSHLLRPHPWHGVQIGDAAPDVVTVYIEMVPTDTVKYEIDKETGFLKVDRPQLYSSFCPTLYGFIPQTFCAEQVASMSRQSSEQTGFVGDHDPLDICVLTEKQISHADILLKAIPIGGLRMIDGNEADDKILAVLEGDAAYGSWTDITDCPESMINRLKHYFLTYKDFPPSTTPKCEITAVYGKAEAHEVIRRSQEDYQKHFSDLFSMLQAVVSDYSKRPS